MHRLIRGTAGSLCSSGILETGDFRSPQLTLQTRVYMSASSPHIRRGSSVCSSKSKVRAFVDCLEWNFVLCMKFWKGDSFFASPNYFVLRSIFYCIIYEKLKKIFVEFFLSKKYFNYFKNYYFITKIMLIINLNEH